MCRSIKRTILARGAYRWVRVDGDAAWPDLEVEMGRCVSGVPRIAEVPDDGAPCDSLAARDPACVCFEMCVVVLRAVARVEVCRLAAKRVRTQLDRSVDHCNEWCVAGSEHVDALVASATGPRKAPRVDERSPALDRADKARRGRGR